MAIVRIDRDNAAKRLTHYRKKLKGIVVWNGTLINAMGKAIEGDLPQQVYQVFGWEYHQGFWSSDNSVFATWNSANLHAKKLVKDKKLRAHDVEIKTIKVHP